MKAVQIGAGNIGRGFLGQLYHESGFDITFIDSNLDLVQALNERGEYPIEIVDPVSTVWVRGFRAVAADTEEAHQAIAKADIVSTSVGALVLPKVLPMIAEGSGRRNGRVLDVMLAENLHDAAIRVRDWLTMTGASADRIGIIEASIGRMVPLMTEEQRKEDPLKIRTEAFCELPVDADAFLGPVPPIAHLRPTGNFCAILEKKLYLHNLGHSAAAYLGSHSGCTYIWQAMEDSTVALVVADAMQEASLGLHRRHGLDLDELHEHSADLMRRFGSRALGDTVARVAADPVRKLAHEDRIIGALRMCEEQAVQCKTIIQVAAAALRYDNDADKPSQILQRAIAAEGLRSTLATVCGVDPNSDLGRKIVEAYSQF